MTEHFEDLATFLKVQIHTDAALAREALADWKTGPDGDEMAGAVESILIGGHLVRWSPHRVLAECDAKRRIVELHGPVDKYDTDSCRECSDSGWAGCVDGHSRVPLPCPTLRLLALLYGDRPGYRPEWRPT